MYWNGCARPQTGAILTWVLYSLTSVLKVMAVRDVVTTPVKIDVITRPTRTQIIAKIRATNPRGERSPYLWRKYSKESSDWFSPTLCTNLPSSEAPPASRSKEQRNLVKSYWEPGNKRNIKPGSWKKKLLKFIRRVPLSLQEHNLSISKHF